MDDGNFSDPTKWELSTWLLCIGMAVCGGIANWSNKIARGYITHFSFVELIGEMFVSGFAGVSVFMALAGMGKTLLICAAASGVTGHFATRIIFHIEQILRAKAEKMISDINNSDMRMY